MDNFEPVSKIDPNEIPDGFTSGEAPQNPEQEARKEQMQSILQQALTADALARLGRIKLVKKQKAEQLEAAIVNMAVSGKLPGKINEGKLIEMLERGNAKQTTSSINIQRKKYAFDSDDDEDDDDI